MLNSPARKQIATAKPLKIKGVALASVIAIPSSEPNAVVNKTL